MMFREVDNTHANTNYDEKRSYDGMPSATSPLPNASPFLLKSRDVESLAQSDGFSILRNHLADHYTYEYALRTPSHGSYPDML
jgi:hypothetical protein